MSTLEIIKGITDELANEELEDEKRSKGLLTERAQEHALEIDGGKFNEGFENIMQCVNTPLEESISQYGIRLMAIIASSYTTGAEDERKYSEVESKIKELTENMDADDALIIDIKDKLHELHKNRSALDTEYRAVLESNEANQRMKLRSISDELGLLHEVTDDHFDALKKTVTRRKFLEAELDAKTNELNELKTLSLGDMFNARAMLFHDPTWSGHDDTDEKLSPSAKRTLIDAFKKPILDKLSNFHLSKEYDSQVKVGVLAIPPPSGAFNGSARGDLNRFKESEVAKKLSNILKLHISSRHGDFSNRLFRDVVLMDTPQKTEINDFQQQMYYLNLTAMAGYDPIRWARAFGVPISGIGKQILREWNNGRTGPLTPERLIKLFESKALPFTAALSYAEMEREVARSELKQDVQDKREAEAAHPRAPQRVIVVKQDSDDEA
uniref:Uncharacterized protein n=1 Tax=viral metagenome TaxID=1070528 RepID=A0A2V0RHB3_9ZZZZ